MKNIQQLHEELKLLNFSYPNDTSENDNDVIIALNETQNYINIRQYENALYTIKKVSFKLKSSVDKKFLAECYIINKDYSSALTILHDILKVDTFNCQILSLCSGIYMNIGDITNAIKYNNEILKINKNNKSACINNNFFNKYKKNKKENGHYSPNDSEISIFTSISPKNPTQSIAAIESWIKLGFHVYSCNYKNEIQELKNYFPCVHFIEVENPKIFLYGKKTIRLVDVFAAIEKYGCQVSGIVNSDIVFRCDNNIRKSLVSECDDALVYGARVDVLNHNEYNGRMYDNGFDFFFFKKNTLNKIPDNLFAIGHPWWDYFLPISFYATNQKVKQLNSPIGFHQKHIINWDTTSWNYYGVHMTQMFSPDVFSFMTNILKDNHPLQSFISSTASVFKNTPRILELCADPIYFADQFTSNAFSNIDVFKEKFQILGTKVEFLEQQ